MSLSFVDNFERDGIIVVAAHSPLVAYVNHGSSTNPNPASGFVTLEINGVSPADNQTVYTFDMAYVSRSGSGPYTDLYRLDISDIIRKICNDPDLRNEITSGSYFEPSRLATQIRIIAKASGEIDETIASHFMHGFNQVNDQNSSCLVPFGEADGDALISVVPGAPMIWQPWCNLATTGTYYARLYDGDGVAFGVAISFTSPQKELYQFYNATLNGDLYDEWDNKTEVFEMRLIDTGATTVIGNIKGVAFKQACEGDVLLAWLNRYGIYSYMAFERFPTIRGEQKHIGSFDITIDDLADVQSRTKSRGYNNVRDVISAVARNVPTEYFEAVEDLFYSMDVYYFTGTLPENTFDSTEWVRVKVRGNLTNRKKHSHENVRIDIQMPEKFTQLR